MPAERFLKAEVGLQTAFGTPVSPTIMVPLTGSYENQDVWHEAPYDSGTWTPTTIREKVQTAVQVSFRGTGIFEMLPVFFNSGYEDVAPSVTYLHTYTINPAAVAVPKPLTARLGAVGTNIGATGPAMIASDLYLRSWRLSGNVTGDKSTAFEATMFGSLLNDSSGAGVAFIGSALPVTLETMKALKGTLNIEDAAVAGGAFATMTAFSGSLLDWEINGTTGIEPAFSGDGNILTFYGIKHVPPVHTMRIAIRTNATNYALIYGKANAGTYQELQYTLNGSGSRVFTCNLTGAFTECRTAHARNNNEVVMEATLTAQTPHTQTTTPHYAAILVNSTNNWT
jgi:hypothetical protein